MRRFRSTAAAIAALTLLLVAQTALAQGAPTRLVVFPFDVGRSIEALGLASASAVQRALNQVDGVFVPPVGDALLVLQRANEAGLDPIETARRLFQADALVLARITGQSQLEVELVVVVGSEDRSETLRGQVADLTALWRSVAETSLRLAGVGVSPADLSQLRGALERAPSLPALGPLGVAASRLPAVRLGDLEMALELDPDSAWLRSETARVAALEGSIERAVELAVAAAERAPHVAEVRAIEGIVLATAGESERAEAAYRAALAINPDHALALSGLADLEQDPIQQLASLDRALAAAPRLVDAHLHYVSLQTDAQRRLQALRRATERLPDSLTLQRALQNEVLSLGDPRGALALLRQAASDPMGRSSALYALAARLPDSVGPEALAFVREGRRAFPDSASLALAEADLLVAAGELAQAEALLREVVEADPASLVAVEALASVLGRSGRLEEAQDLLRGALDDGEGLTTRLLELQLRSGQARQALATLAPRIEAGERDPLLRTYYGIALGRVGRIDEARAVLESVLAESPELTLAGRALNLLEQQERIVGDEGALVLDGEAAVAFEQGLSALEIGDWVQAADGFTRARELGDAGLLAFYQGYSLQRAGDSRAAIDAYRAARASLGDNDVLLSNLGYAHLQVGRLDLALEALQAAVASNPANAQAHFNLGLTYFGIARFIEAIDSLEHAVELAPDLSETAAPFLAESRRRSQR
jgi:tetratricopeptide (TPR) repeat protein